jgi:IPT/TIG domain
VVYDWGDRSEPTVGGSDAARTASHVYQVPRSYRIRAQAYTRGGAKIGGPGFTDFNAGAPVLTGMTPNFGPEAGGTGCIIDGINLAMRPGDQLPVVMFGSNQATNIQLLGSTSIACTSPAGSGLASVVAVAPLGTNPVQFEYRAED